MKKIIALILTLVVLTALLTVPAMAEETISIDFEGVGVTLEVPQAFQETKGVLDAGDGNELGYNTGWYYMEMDYVAMSMDEYIDLMNKDEWTEEDQDNYRASMGNLFMMFSVAPTTSLEKMADYLATMGMTLNMDDVTEIGEADGYTFYLFQDLDDDISAFRPEFAEEFTSLRAMVPEIAAGATLYVPAKPYADVIGKTLTFTTTDVEGNPVTSEELFGQHEITMLNLWTSQCHFCIEELPPSWACCLTETTLRLWSWGKKSWRKTALPIRCLFPRRMLMISSMLMPSPPLSLSTETVWSLANLSRGKWSMSMSLPLTAFLSAKRKPKPTASRPG